MNPDMSACLDISAERRRCYRVLGIDPGLQFTGWGIVDFDGYRLKYVGHGVIATASDDDIAVRLSKIFVELSDVITKYGPSSASVESVFININPASSMKLCMARGAAISAPAVAGIKVSEYAPNKIKKTIVGAGHATKEQISFMVQKLLNCGSVKRDAADALAIAICHAHCTNSYLVEK